MGPLTTIPLRERVHDSHREVYLGTRVAEGGAGWKRGTDWLAVSWGACLPAGKGHRREQE